MCRLFGYRGSSAAKVDRLLLDSKSSLAALSHEHQHGWGIGHYSSSQPILLKGTAPAFSDPEFVQRARTVTSDCILAHVRRRSVGGRSLEDCHPFTYGRLLFAHNGTVQGFDGLRPQIEAAIKPKLRPLLKGTTDSERCFLLLLGHLDDMGALDSARIESLALAMARTIAQIRALPAPANQPHMLTFLLTDGSSMIGARAGEKELWLSTRESERPGKLERCYFASQPLTEEETWTRIEDGELVGVDGAMQLRRWRIDEIASRMVL
jgi:glutamine amidotransferase